MSYELYLTTQGWGDSKEKRKTSRLLQVALVTTLRCIYIYIYIHNIYGIYIRTIIKNDVYEIRIVFFLFEESSESITNYIWLIYDAMY